METADFREAVIDLYDYFRIAKPPRTETVLSMYNNVSDIPADKFNQIINQIKAQNDNIPRNLPKAIRAIYFQMPRTKVKIHYDKYDDPRFPLEQLQQAFYILDTDGQDAFKRYCLKTSMPDQDKERVYSKWRYIHDPEFRKKIERFRDRINNRLTKSDLVFKPEAKERKTEYPDEVPF